MTFDGPEIYIKLQVAIIWEKSKKCQFFTLFHFYIANTDNIWYNTDVHKSMDPFIVIFTQKRVYFAKIATDLYGTYPKITTYRLKIFWDLIFERNNKII